MRIAGITLPEQKRMELSLTAIYGIGRPMAHEILEEAKVDLARRIVETTIENW